MARRASSPGKKLILIAALGTFLTMVAVPAGAASAEAQAIDPSFSVRMSEQEIHGYHWEQAVPVTLSIDDPATGPGVDYSDTQLALPPEWDPTMGFVQFQPFVDDFVIEPGFIVTMSQMANVRTHTVTSLTVTDVNETTDVVSGTGDDGAVIDVSIWDESGTWRQATVTGGIWSADFSIAGPGGDPVDITRGTQGEAAESDDDGDNTQWSWRIPDPAFSVETPRGVWSFNDGWIPGRTVTVTVDDNDVIGDGVLFQATTIVQSWGPGPWEAGWSIDQLPFNIVPGHYVTADDGVEVSKTLQVIDLSISSVDPVADDIVGTAPVGSFVDVHGCEEFTCANVTAQADTSGVWIADFSGLIEIEPGFGGSAQIYDEDGDSTHRGWQLHEPYFGVDVANEEMWAANWPAGETLTFQVFADDTEADLLWTDTMTVFGTPWQNTEAGYRFWGEFDVAGGQYFTVTDGVTSKDLVVSTVSITEVNPDGDYYTGTVDPTVPADVAAEVCAWARMLSDVNNSVERCDLPDPVAGDWTIDFTGVGDIIPGDHLGVSQRDLDGDETSHSWGVPPWIYVELAEKDDGGVDLYPDRVGLDQWIGPVDIFVGGLEVMSDVITSGGYVQIDLDVEVGETIRVVDAHDDKSLYIEELTVDSVTAWDDPIRPSTAFGTAAIPDNTRHVQVTASADYGWWTERWVPVISEHYEADFANPGNGWRESEIGYFGEGGADDVYLGGEVRAHLWDFDNDQVQAIWHTCNPRIIIVRGNDRIEAVCFPEGSELVIELDDLATGVGVDWASGDPVVVTRNPDKPWETLVVFELGEYTAPDDAAVTATATEGGVPVVVVTTEVVAFTIGDIDADNDRITGTAPPDSQVLVEADGNWRYPTADAAGIWVADFSVPGESPGEENPVNIGPGTSGGATLIDEGGSATTVLWRLSAASFGVDPTQNNMWGNEFAPDTSVNITVAGVDRGDYPTDGSGQFNAGWDPGDLDLAEDMVIEVTDGDTTKTHIVTALVVTDVNDTDDTVSGTAAPGSDVDVWVHDTDAWRHAVADGETGAWSAEFGVAGDESGEAATADLTPGSNGNTGQCDEDGDCTNANWWVVNPAINVDPHGDWLWGNQWAPDSSAVIAINGTEHSTLPTNESGDFGDGWDPAGLALQVGDEIVVTDGVTTKTHIVTPLAITSIDSDTDIVTGTATRNGAFDIWVHDSDAWRHVEVDDTGLWAVDWGIPATGDNGDGTADLHPGSNGNSNECDTDGDCTFAGWNVPNPTFVVDPQNDGAWGNQFVPFATITLTRGSDICTTDADDGGNFGFDLPNCPTPIDIQIGNYVEVSDGAITKALTITDVTITAVDPDLDTVSGTADAEVQVALWGTEIYPHVERFVTANEFGDWSANFAVAIGPEDWQQARDITPDTNGGATQRDGDGDGTQVGFGPGGGPEFWFSVETPYQVWGDGELWQVPVTVDLTVDDDDDPTNGTLFTDSTMTEVMGTEPWERGFRFDLEGAFEIQPGHFVTITSDFDDDGVLEVDKTLHVVDIHSVNVDPETGVVSGFTDPDVWVNVNGNTESEFAWRNVQADGTGYFQADLANPVGAGEEGESTITIPFTEGTGGAIQVNDDDGDSTHQGWCHQCDGGGGEPYIEVDPFLDRIFAYDWPDPGTLEVTINGAPVSIEPVDRDGRLVYYLFDTFDITTGSVVEATDGETTKQHQVVPLEVIDIDASADTITGTTNAGAWVSIAAGHDENGAWRWEEADGGTWTADFGASASPPDGDGTYDIVKTVSWWLRLAVPDDDGDATVFETPQAVPGLGVYPELGIVGVEGSGLGPITISIPDLGYETTAEPEPDRFGTIGDLVFDKYALDPEVNLWGRGVEFDVGDLVPGMVVRSSDVMWEMELTILEFWVDEADTAAGTLSGFIEGNSRSVFSYAFRDYLVNEPEDLVGIGLDTPLGGQWTLPFCTPQSSSIEECDPYGLVSSDVGFAAGLEVDHEQLPFDTYTMVVWDLRPHIASLAVTPDLGTIDPDTWVAEVALHAVFTDIEVPDGHTATIDWGDGVSVGAVTPGPGPGSGGTVDAVHMYAAPGVYTVTLTVEDEFGHTDTVSYEMVAFVTGGGWIDSPEGAYPADPSLTGKATFGFVSRYKKGTAPTGETEFQFQPADLNFHSSSYDWLVVSGYQAIYSGTGTINGSGEYGFMVSVIDAKLTPSPDDADRFRIKIWDDDGVVYDSLIDAADDADPGTELGGGSIVIH